ncbi:MAG: MBL fold metallo-hydrolase [Prolixibacteraceae bacterium]|jgi:phosphoribosyl 1,2-cyclic phosphodiesterase|nr:MBL fold metallo-hydrolase [Prolixibacteraceae bacterium]
MKLKVIGSSSLGNGYVLEEGDTSLVIECGAPLKKMLPFIDFDIEKVSCAVVSHSHGDHSGYIKQYLERGITVYNNVFKHYNSVNIEHNKLIKHDSWNIIPLKMEHDVECYGFLIKSPLGVTALFATDTFSIPYNIKGVNHAIIESNFEQEHLDNKQVDHKINHYLASRIEQSHLSYEKCKDWLLNNNDSLETVTLIHLSDSNSLANKFVADLQESLCVPVEIADSNKVFNLGF